MSESSDSSSQNSDSDGEDLKKKHSSSEEETELPKQLKSSDIDDEDDEDDDDDDDDDDAEEKSKSEASGSGSQSESGDNKDSDSNAGSDQDEEKDDTEDKKASIKRSLFDTDSQDTGDNDARNARRPIAAIRELKEEWDQKPDLYGIRRSGRSRREIVRYNIGNSDSENEGRKKKKGRRRRGSDDWRKGDGDDDDDDDEEEDDSDDSSASEGYREKRKPTRRSRPPPRGKKRKSSKPVTKSKSRSRNLSSSGTSEDSDGYSRPISQRKSAQKVRSQYRPSRRKVSKKTVSYKEENTDEATDSDDIIEAATPVVEEEDNRETIEKVLEVRKGRKGATGHKTTVYNVQQSSDPNLSPLKEGEKEEFETQYFIKWKNWAHIHNTWETEACLREQRVNGIKKLENFIKREEEINEWKSAATPEDVDYYECQLEMMEDLVESHKCVERIIAHRKESHGGSDYLCKWKGLPYSECTWEDGELVSTLFQSHIDQHLARNKSQCIPTKLSRVLKVRPKFVPLKEQPSHLGDGESLKLRDYQLDGLNWMLHAWCKENSVILADEMGLGKTIQIITFISQLHNHYHLYGPFLLVVPLSTVVAWQREFEKWAPEINVIIYIGDVSSRTVIREQEWRHPGNKRLKFNVLITTYEILLKDKSFLAAESWAFLGVDEAHRLKNDDSLLYRSLETFDTNHRILITGTPLQNSLKELWSLLHFIMPNKFDSWPDFESKHSKDEGKGFQALHKQLEPFLLRRVKKDVEKSLPAKTEQILRVHLSSLQKTYYRAILKREFKILIKGRKGNVSSYANIMMELKKCANHAHLVLPLDQDEALDKRERLSVLLKGSGKLMLLDKLLVRLKETGHRVLIFSQMVRMLDIVADYLQCRHFPFQRLDGSIRGDLRKQALDHFNADGSQEQFIEEAGHLLPLRERRDGLHFKLIIHEGPLSDFCFLLSTRAGGLGINLATADTVIIFDSDWNPQNDLQAQARAHRIGQKKQVSVYRLVTNSTVEEKIVESAKKKMVLDHLVIQRMDSSGRTVLDKGSGPSSSSSSVPFSKEELCAILKFGAEELFKGNENEEEEEQQVDIDDILNRAEIHETETSGVGDELLSQFNVASFGNLEEEHESRTSFGDEEEKDWEEIIPEDVRMKMEEEERQQQLLDLELGPRNRKTIKQLQVDYDSDKDKKKKKKKHDSESEASDEDDDDDDDDHPKRRGRPKGAAKDGIRGFSNAEIRRFIKSYKKFAAPMKRLDAIAEDSELQEKSEAELRRLAEFIKRGCEDMMKEHNQKMQENASSEIQKKSNKGPTFKIASVSINAQSLLKSEEDLKPLADAIPDDKDSRKKWRIDQHVKKVHWDCFWNIDDDSNLLKGIYEYGMGSWEAIKMDPDLGLSDRILPDGELKPQAKHLQTRVEFLLKSFKKDSGPPVPKIVKPRGKRNPKSKAEIIDKDDSSSSDDNKEKKHVTSEDAPKKKSTTHVEKEKKEVKKENDLSDISDTDLESEDDKSSKPKYKPKPKPNKKPKKEVKEEKKEKKEVKPDIKPKNKKKQQSGPMHFTAVSEPKEIADEEEEPQKMEPKVFDQCKEKMRPLKKVLKQLSEPDESLDEKEQVAFIRSILLKIGDHINVCMEGYSDPDKIKFWRDQLWLFVSNFTTLNHNKLRKLYKGACKKRDSDPKKSVKKSKKAENDTKQKSTSMKRSHDGNKEGSGGGHPKKPHHSVHRNDRSHHSHSHQKDGSVNSNPSKSHHHQRGPGHHNPHWSGAAKDGSQLSEAASSGSPSNNWTLASPLSRAEDVSRSRYDSSANSYNRQHHPHSNSYSSHHDSHRPDRGNGDPKDSYHRYSNDRQGPGGQHYHRDYRGRNEHRAGYRPDPHRGEHYRPEYGNHYRDQGPPSSQHYGRSGDDWGGSNSDRKRRSDWGDRPDDHYDWDNRRSHKDPRMDSKSRYPSSTSNPSSHSSQPPPPGESPSYSHH